MKIGEHRGREIRFAEHVKKFEVGATTDDLERFDSYQQAVDFIDREAAQAAKGRKVALEATALVGGRYTSADTESVDVVVTGLNRGSRKLTTTGIPTGKEIREIFVRHPVVPELIEERKRLRSELHRVEALLEKLYIPHGQGYGRLQTVEEYERQIATLQERHAAALSEADAIWNRRATARAASPEIGAVAGETER